MIMAMISHCSAMNNTEVLCLASSYEAVMHIASMTEDLAKYTNITVSTVTTVNGWNGCYTNILIGMPLEMSRTCLSNIDMQSIQFICFDDGDFTLMFDEVSHMLKTGCAKLFVSTSSYTQELENKLDDGIHSLSVFKVANVLNIPVHHIIVQSEEKNKIQELLAIVGVAQMRKKRTVIFCKVSKKYFIFFKILFFSIYLNFRVNSIQKF